VRAKRLTDQLVEKYFLNEIGKYIHSISENFWKKNQINQ
jgi:hypothetical protein